MVGAVIVERLAGGADIGESIFVLLAVLLYATVGALITSRQAGNRVGLLFAWVGLSASISLLAGSYATLAQLKDLPLLPAAAWVGRVGFAAMFGPLAFLFLIFPTGQPPSRRWGWLLRVMLVAFAVLMIGFALTPGSLEAGFAELPSRSRTRSGSPSSWKPAIETITTVAGLIVAAGALLSVVS